MTIEPLHNPSDPDWLALRRALWPEGSEAEHLEEVTSFVEEPERYAQFLVRDEQGEVVGASDALVQNRRSHAVHKHLGFEETERVVYFCRRLDE